MKRPFALTTVVLLFMNGILAGVLGTHLYYARQLGKIGGPVHFERRMFSEELERRLDLTPEQQIRIDRILEEGHAESAALRAELHPRVKAHMDRTHERIREVLTPEQRDELDRMRKRHRRRAEHFFLGPPGHPGPPGPGGRRRHAPPPDPDSE